eukprot:TRINITY_DN49966_c0_g1_i1.p1 TRINITY_DN49966_c0_g1~~TRINITY_DN49966_c0_g1_i1.p1  ORF type:complete len:137 (-),score=0.21 TRINITY_DN49966_c0_g1_i1:190-600(-)
MLEYSEIVLQAQTSNGNHIAFCNHSVAGSSAIHTRQRCPTPVLGQAVLRQPNFRHRSIELEHFELVCASAIPERGQTSTNQGCMQLERISRQRNPRTVPKAHEAGTICAISAPTQPPMPKARFDWYSLCASRSVAC